MALARTSYVLALALAAVAPGWAAIAADGGAGAEAAQIQALKPNGSQRHRLREIITYIHRQHYAKDRVASLGGEALFDSMMETLDPGNRVFLAQEVEEMRESYTRGLGRTLSRSDLKAPFAMYNRWRKRTIDLWARSYSRLEGGEVDIDAPEFFTLDTDEAPRLENLEDLHRYWDQQTKYALVSRLVEFEDPSEAYKLQKARVRNRLKYLRDLDDEDAFHTAVSAVFHLLDPHSSYLTPEDAKDFRMSLGAQLEGIGAVLTTRDDYIEIVRLIPGGPAMRSGAILPGDRIIAVSGEEGKMEDILGMRMGQVLRMIRGDKGTQVSLELIGPAPFGGAVRRVDLVRDVIKPEDQTAKGEVVEIQAADGSAMRIGVLELPRFYGRYDSSDVDSSVAHEDLLELIEGMGRDDLDGVVLDLRGNGGGYLKEAIDVAGLFLRSGKVVQVHDNRGRIQPHGSGRMSAPPPWTGPFAVLVNRLSASASEIVSAAIQDYGRGLVVGTPTFGKGSVQTATGISRKGGQINITQSMYYRVTGESTQQVGVRPDVLLPQVWAPDQVGESSYDMSLPPGRLHTSRPRPYDEWEWDSATLQSAHESRRDRSPGLSYLMERTQLVEALRERKEIPIWVEGYRQMVESDRARRLAIENRLREAHGEPVFADWWAYNEHLRELARSPGMQSVEDRVLRREAAQVLADQIIFQRLQEGGQLVQVPAQP